MFSVGIGINWYQISDIGTGWHQSSGIDMGGNFGICTSLMKYDKHTFEILVSATAGSLVRDWLLNRCNKPSIHDKVTEFSFTSGPWHFYQAPKRAFRCVSMMPMLYQFFITRVLPSPRVL